MKTSPLKTYGLLFLSTLLLDRLTKTLMVHRCYDGVDVFEFLSFDILYNRGISWGMLSGSADEVVTGVTVVIALVLGLLAWYTRQQHLQGKMVYAETLVLSGGLGNLLDRFAYRGVVDFINVSCGQWQFPAFNVADICVVTGVGLMLYKMFKTS